MEERKIEVGSIVYDKSELGFEELSRVVMRVTSLSEDGKNAKVTVLKCTPFPRLEGREYRRSVSSLVLVSDDVAAKYAGKEMPEECKKVAMSKPKSPSGVGAICIRRPSISRRRYEIVAIKGEYAECKLIGDSSLRDLLNGMEKTVTIRLASLVEDE